MTLPGREAEYFSEHGFIARRGALSADWQPVRILPNHACATAAQLPCCQAMAVVSTSPLAGNAFTAGCTPL